MKGEGEKGRYSHLNAEFQRIARRDKKAFLSDQCKEINENNKMGKTRDLFKNIRDTKGTFHAKVGTIKDGNGMDLREAEDINKRWQEYIKGICRCKSLLHVALEFLYKKDLNDLDNHNGVITHLEPNILECEVKWTSLQTKLVEVMEFQLSYFQILKGDAVEMLHSICQKIWKTQQWPLDWKRSVFIPIQKKRQCQRMFRLLHNCTHLTH